MCLGVRKGRIGENEAVALADSDPKRTLECLPSDSSKLARVLRAATQAGVLANAVVVSNPPFTRPRNI